MNPVITWIPFLKLPGLIAYLFLHSALEVIKRKMSFGALEVVPEEKARDGKHRLK